MMRLLCLRAQVDHPAARLLRRHREASVEIRPRPLLRGFGSEHAVSGPAAFLDSYRGCLERSARDGCVAPARVTRADGRMFLLHGPCACDGRAPACRALADLQARLDEALPHSRIESATLRFDGCTVLASSFGEPPTDLERPGLRLLGSCLRPPPRAALPAASAAQLRVLLAAWDMGYYETPRRCTLQDLAHRLGLAKSLVCRRLQSIEQDAVGRLLGDGEHVDRSVILPGA